MHDDIILTVFCVIIVLLETERIQFGNVIL